MASTALINYAWALILLGMLPEGDPRLKLSLAKRQMGSSKAGLAGPPQALHLLCGKPTLAAAALKAACQIVPAGACEAAREA